MADALSSGQRPFYKAGMPFDKFREDLETYLSTKGLLRITNGEERYPTPVDPEQLTRDERLDLEKYDNHKSQASGEILLAVEEPIRETLRAAKEVKGDPAKMLKLLEEKYDQKVPGARFKSYNEFFSLTLPTDVPPELVLTTLTDNVKLALSQLRRQRPGEFTIEDLEDELASMVTLRALHSSSQEKHRTLAQSFEIRDSLAFSDIETAARRTLHTSTTVGVKQEENPIVLSMAAAALVCYLCEGPHLVRDCPSLNAAKENLKNGKTRGGRIRGRGRGTGNANAAETPTTPQPTATASRATAIETAGEVLLHL